MSGFDRLSATLRLDAPVTSLPGISGKRAAALSALGVESVRDLLGLYPRRYLDHSRVVPIAQLEFGSSCTVVGTVHEVTSRRTRRGLSLTQVTVVDGTGTLLVVCFNQPWLARKLEGQPRVGVAGTVEFDNGFARMVNPTFDVLQPDEASRGSITPIYPANARISRQAVRSAVLAALQAVQGAYDPLPLELRVKYRLPSQTQAWRAIHAPESMDEVAQAHRRLRYEELFLLEVRLLGEEQRRRFEHPGRSQRLSEDARGRLEQALGFPLTSEQRAAVDDILEAMAADSSADHLVLGDVGTGKTAVALFAIAAAAESGNQVLMMGPTEVLVRQYATSVGACLDALGISWDILTASTPKPERARILDAFASGGLSVLLGTHALLDPDVVPQRLGLTVIDEQQRFGVDQRQALQGKDPAADRLALTATPIPRSLALVLFGNLGVSYLKTRPNAQAVRTTRALPFAQEAEAYDAIRAAIGRGEQAYVVCPLIGISTEELDEAGEQGFEVSRPQAGGKRAAKREASGSERGQGASSGGTRARRPVEERDAAGEHEGRPSVSYAAIEWGLQSETIAASAADVANHAKILQETVFPNARVGVLHGRMKPEEKDRAMRAFKEGAIDVLVSTTVVEVGVDVPNATVMLVEDADRFGLAQLHQLRGRVGRGGKASQVFLVSRSKAPQALERLAAMESTDDGFALSEFDLALRREGDVFGDRQSGASSLKLVNVVRDAAVIEAAHDDAERLMERARHDLDARRRLQIANQAAHRAFGG